MGKFPKLEPSTKFEKFVARWVREHARAVGCMRRAMEELDYGCETGIVGDLVYTTDIHRVYRKYCDDIHDVLREFAEDVGQPMHAPPDTDTRTWFTWRAFEIAARNLAYRAEVEW